MNVRGQGALELLLLVGGAVLLALVVISVLSSTLQGAQTGNSVQTVQQKTANATTNALQGLDSASPSPPFSLAYSFGSGNNGFALNLTLSVSLTAAGLLAQLPACTQITRQDPASYGSTSLTYQTYSGGGPVSDFPIESGKGYLVNCTAAQSVTLSGSSIPVFSDPVLYQYSTFVGFPGIDQVSPPYTAENYLIHLNVLPRNCRSISRWNGTTWVSHTLGIPINNFTLTPTQAYVVSCTSV
ncbi:MAG: hypothetical protein HY917_00710 [Candidatus Diapherotrites archaeon]|nr:hypothetical protein [Candidatus Diapherotrites archaeon]